MPKFVHVDIAADDPERAVAFFRKVFGWEANKLDGPVPYWLIGPAGDPEAVGAGIAKREESWQSTTPTIEVESADDSARRIVEAGGEIIIPKTDVGIGYVVTFKDTEGNVFAVLEPAKDAGPR